MFSKINQQTSIYISDLLNSDVKGKHFSQLFPVVTKHCPCKEHTATQLEEKQLHTLTN